ncbi:MAG: hypothetical protein L6Q71_03070, partial [Planctomycetes bacterium]|nr:hypothetical protein [Planctomycetota bacterium]
YGMITWQTAWLKTNYPAQYAAALVSCSIGNNDKVIWYVRRVREMGVEVMPPDINRSHAEFTTHNNAVVFGLSGMKGAGTKAVEAILEAREKAGGSFKGFMHFLESIDHTAVPRSVIEALIRGGAFDSFKLKRAALLQGVEDALRAAAGTARDKARGQANLFGGGAIATLSEADEHKRDLQTLPDVAEWNDAERQRAEKEAFGFYITTSPIDTHLQAIENFRTHTSTALQDEGPGRHVVLGGMIRAIKARKVKSESSRNFGRTMADMELEDPEGVVRITVFPDQYESMSEHLVEDRVVFLRGMTEERDEEIGVTLLEVVPVERAAERFADDALVKYGKLFRAYCRPSPDMLRQLGEGSGVTIAGVASKPVAKPTKKGTMSLQFTVVSTEGSARVMCFGKVYETAKDVVKENAAVYIKGKTVFDERSATLFADEVISFEDAQRSRTGAVCVKFTTEGVSKPALENLRGILSKHKGPLPLFLKLEQDSGTSNASSLLLRVDEKTGVTAAPQLFTELEATFGEGCYEVVAR